MSNGKLWVDDLRLPPDETWTVAKTSEDAIRIIATIEFDEISLDHDIVNRVDTFQPVAYFIGAKYYVETPLFGTPGVAVAKPLFGPKITIHSGNPVGARTLANILDRYGVRSVMVPVLYGGEGAG